MCEYALDALTIQIKFGAVNIWTEPNKTERVWEAKEKKAEWGEKNEQRKWPSQLLCYAFALLCTHSVLLSNILLFHRSWYTVPLFSVQSYVQFYFVVEQFVFLCLKISFLPHIYLIVTIEDRSQFTLICHFAIPVVTFFFILQNCFKNYNEKMRPNNFAWFIVINCKYSIEIADIVMIFGL